MYVWDYESGEYGKFEGDINEPFHFVDLLFPSRTTTISSNLDVKPTITLREKDLRLQDHAMEMYRHYPENANAFFYPELDNIDYYNLRVTFPSLEEDDSAPLSLNWQIEDMSQPIRSFNVADMWQLYGTGEMPLSAEFNAPVVTPFTLEINSDQLFFTGLDDDQFDVAYLSMRTNNGSTRIYLDARNASINLDELEQLVDISTLRGVYVLLYDYEQVESFEAAMRLRFAPEFNYNAFIVGSYFRFP